MSYTLSSCRMPRKKRGANLARAPKRQRDHGTRKGTSSKPLPQPPQPVLDDHLQGVAHSQMSNGLTRTPKHHDQGTRETATSEPLPQPYQPALDDNNCILFEMGPTEIKQVDFECEGSELRDSDGFYAHGFYVITDYEVIPCDPHDDTDKLYESSSRNCYQMLNTELNEPSIQQRVLETTGYIKCTPDELKFVDIYKSKLPGVRSVVLFDDHCNASIYVHRQLLSPTHPLWNTVSKMCSSPEQINHLLKTLSLYDVCVGNPDEEFSSLNPGLSEFREENYGAVNGKLLYEATFRAQECELFINGLRCKQCIQKRGALRKRRHSAVNTKIDYTLDTPLSANTKHSLMSPEQLKCKIKALQKNRRSQDGRIRTLQQKLQDSIDKEAHQMSPGDTREINKMVKDCDGLVREQWPDENSFQRLFWEEQLKYNAAKSASGMRWHPMIIKWCLHLKTKSSAAYNALRDTGFIKLPSMRTLYNYSHFMQAGCGISVDALKHLRSELAEKDMLGNTYRNYIGLLIDEVKIKEDLVYDKHSGELIGFIDLDKTGNQLMALEQAMLNDNPTVAKYMLVFMVRGACTDFKYPLSCYATDGIKSELLDTVVWDAVETLEVNIGVRILYMTCDGASPNRRFFDLHGDGKPVWFTQNLVDPSRNIYFISDPPHLIKTARNCFANSGSHKMSRTLWNNGMCLSWMHIVELFRDHCEDRELTVVPKLTQNHVDLTAFSKMRVALAAEVLSETVACALERYVGPHTSETVKFIRIMNKFFDCMNTRNLSEAARTRNPNKRAYTSVEDDRLAWLTGDFLNYFTQWRKCVMNRPGDFSKQDWSAMMLSHQTLTGLEITARSVVACINVLLNAGAPFVLTSHFNQDILEQLFGHFRHRGGSMENPTVKEVRNMMVEMKATRSVHMACVRGNTKRLNNDPQIDHRPLPKRPAIR